MRVALRCCAALLIMCNGLTMAQTHRSYLASVYVGKAAKGEGSHNSCAVVGDDGQFRLELWTSDKPNRKNTRIYVGHLSTKLLQQLRTLVNTPELVGMGTVLPKQKVLVHNNAEIVSLHLHRAATTQEIVIVNNDNLNPIPEPVRAFEPWMEALESSAGSPLDDAEPRQCQALDFMPGYTPRLQRR